MRIWVDGQCFQTGSRSRGIGRYVYSLLAKFVELHPDFEVLVSLSASKPEDALIARRLLEQILPAKNILVWQPPELSPEQVTGYDNARQLAEIALAHHVRALAPDVILSASPFEGITDYTVPLNPSIGQVAPVAQIFYDAIPERYADNYLSDKAYAAAYYRRKEFYRHGDVILAISDFVGAEAADLFPGQACDVIYAGLSDSITALSEAAPRAEKTVDLLYVGALDYRKNARILVPAAKELKARHGYEASLAIVGAFQTFEAKKLRSEWEKSGLDPAKITFHQNASDADLVAFYQSAHVVVQPSLMEGFGLTALESISVGTSVAGSRDTALQEIVLDERALFDPKDPKSISDVLHNLLASAETRQSVLDTQAEALSTFTWAKSAERLLASLQAIGAKGKEPLRLDAARQQTLADLTRTFGDTRFPGLAEILASNEQPVRQDKPHIAIDATHAIRYQLNTGIQRVVNNIITKMPAPIVAAEHAHSVIFCADEEGWFKQGQAIPKAPLKSEPLVTTHQDTILMLDSSWEFQKPQSEALWDARLRGAEIVSCLYDIVPFTVPGMCGAGVPEVFGSWFQTALIYSTGFVCISRAVADELIALLEAINYPREMKVGYWQLGADFDLSAPTEETPEARRSSAKGAAHDFLMVGTLEPRKGHEVALGAFEQLWETGTDTTLTIIGKQGWGTETLAKRILAHPEYGKRLIWEQAASDAQLQAAYASCDALVASSYAEGFGLPIVEAGQKGKPVIASDIPVFREVSGGAPKTTFFDVGSSAGLAEAVKQHICDGAGSDWTPPHWPTWGESAQQLTDILTKQAWYKRYRPKTIDPTIDPNDIGDFVLRRALTDAESVSALEITVAPERIAPTATIDLTVRITNLSDIAWSSAHHGDKQARPVQIGYDLLDAQGAPRKGGNGFVTIPFLLLPGQTMYSAVRIPDTMLRPGDSAVRVQMQQKDVRAMGEAVTAALPQ